MHKGQSFSKSTELQVEQPVDCDVSQHRQQILVAMNASLGSKGVLESITNYWTVATVFEMSILTQVRIQQSWLWT